MSKAELNHLERRALKQASLVCYSSQWAADLARTDYGTAPDKLVVIPFGANYPCPPSRAETVRHAPALDGKCRLLFVGVEWVRKGGEIAYATMEALQRLGVPTTLRVG